jgi:hypothetical protein
MKKVMPTLVEKIMVTYVHLALASCLLATYFFFNGCQKGLMTSSLLLLISNNKETKHITIGLFEVITTNRTNMAPKLQQLLDQFSFSQKILTYVNDERSNLKTCATILNYANLCNNLAMLETFDGSSFGDATLTHELHYASI